MTFYTYKEERSFSKMYEQTITLFFDHIFWYWSISLFFLTVDSLTNITELWSYIKERQATYPVPLFEVVKVVLLNQVITLLCLLSTSDFPEGNFLVLENLYKIPTTFLTLEFLFFYSHCLLHSLCYNRVHSIHHSWTVPNAIATLYAHPIEHIASNIAPILISAKFAGLNYTTARYWHIFALVNSLVKSHGGYKISSFHLHHHLYRNCNFGAIGLLDRLHGTLLK